MQSRFPNTVFIAALSPRSGTNYLARIIASHDDMVLARQPFWEDYFLYDADLLTRFGDNLFDRYRDIGFGADEQARQHLLRLFGDSLLELVYQGSEVGSRVVLKTPMIQGFEHFDRFFHGHKLVVLLRDGRSVVESRVRAFASPWIDVVQAWCGAARFYLDNVRHRVDSMLEVRYEDLVMDTRAQTARLFEYLEIEPAGCRGEEIGALPLFASSFHNLDQGNVNWVEAPRPEGFDPRVRFESWSAAQHATFNGIAGEAMRELGYDLTTP